LKHILRRLQIAGLVWDVFKVISTVLVI